MTAATYPVEPSFPEDEPKIPCPMCAGSGKIRDYKAENTPFPASTYVTGEGFDLTKIYVGYGT